MTSVFLLDHSYEIGEFEETKFIGIYSSRDKAKIVIEKYKGLPGFSDHPDCFGFDEYKIDEDHWTEGFIKWADA